MGEGTDLSCSRCSRKLVLSKVEFTYIGKTFSTEVYRCPSCGKVCILPELAEGKMAEVEHLLEDK